MSVRESQEVKTLDTLIEDIYGVLDNLNTDEGIEIPEELTEEFLASMKESLSGTTCKKSQRVLLISTYIPLLLLSSCTATC